MPASIRRMVVNADDFGLSSAVNRGVALAHSNGILTSTTLLANAPAFEEAVELSSLHPSLGIGVHLNLVRGRPLSRPEAVPDLVDATGRFRGFRVRRMGRPFLDQAEREYRRQIERVLDAGIRPTHVDFEKHHGLQRPLYRLADRLAREYGMGAIRTLREPVWWSVRRLGWPGWRRAATAALMRSAVTLLGGGGTLPGPNWFLGQTHIGAMSEPVWLRLIRSLPPGDYEVMTHPGMAKTEDSPDMGSSWLGEARAVELAALTADAVKQAIVTAGIDLVGYRALWRRS